MNLFRTFLRRIKYNLTYLFGSKINIPSEFRLFERRKTNYEAFINKHCRLTSHNKVNLNVGLKIFGKQFDDYELSKDIFSNFNFANKKLNQPILMLLM